MTCRTLFWYRKRDVSDTSILVVDDDPSIRATVAEFLDLEGFTVATAVNGAEALALIGSALPSLLLLDMRMPVVDGWGLARSMRERGYAVPIIVMTASHSTAQWAAEVNAAGYIAKPFDLDNLLAEVERVLGEHHVPE